MPYNKTGSGRLGTMLCGVCVCVYIYEIENFWVSGLAAKNGVSNVWRQRDVGGCASFVIADGFDEVSVPSKL